jgi:hypothetical protein
MKKIYVYSIFMLFILVSTMFFIRVEGIQQPLEYEEINIYVGVYTSLYDPDDIDLTDEDIDFDKPIGDSVFDIEYYSTEHGNPEKGFEPFPYEWEVGNKRYNIIPEELTFLDFLKGDLKSKFDVIIIDGLAKQLTYIDVPWIQGLASLSYQEYGEYKDIKPNLNEFFNAGGGYIGHCGGGLLPLTTFDDTPRTDHEYYDFYNKFYKGDTHILKNVKTLQYGGQPIFSEWLMPPDPRFPDYSEWQYFLRLIRHPEYTGCVLYLKQLLPTGVPLHFDIEEENKDHPIFKDYHDDSIYGPWIGGSAFKISRDYDGSQIQGLAKFRDEEDLSENTQTGMKAWGWRPGLWFIERLITLSLLRDISNWEDFTEYLVALNTTEKGMRTWTGWKHVNMPIFGNVENRHELDGKSENALITINNFNNEPGTGRLVLCGGHPIYYVFDRDGKYIKRADYTGENTMKKGLYLWMDDINETPLNLDDDIPLKGNHYKQIREKSNLEWFSRREVAWAAGADMVPDDHMPPIYGRSHVVDLYPYQPSEEFTIDCAVGDLKKIKDLWDTTELTLYYKHFTETPSDEELDSATWSTYDTISSFPWSFSFDADLAQGSGVYYFCTKLCTTLTQGNEPVQCDNFPPEPDTFCLVKSFPCADFINKPTSLYTNMNITFYDQSIPSQNIVSWSWDFGDGNTSTDQNATHQYIEKGYYTVVLNVTDNASNYHIKSKNITVQNNPPVVGFNSNQLVVIGPNDDISDNQVVTFESISTDFDGNIVNWTWDFGDGTIGYSQSVNHTYSDQGLYPVTLWVTDNDNATSKESIKDYVMVVNAIVNKSLTFDDPVNHTWNTVQKGMDNLSSFNILHILNNTYIENINITKSIMIFGENRDGVIIDGSITMVNPLDYELLGNGDNDFNVNMSKSELLFHFNNDSSVGENYNCSNVVVDYSGQENNGTLYGPTWIDSSIKGTGALVFNGVNNSVNISGIPALMGEYLTVSAWVYWNEGSGNFDPILSQSNVTHGYCLFVNNSDNKPTFRLGSTNVVSSIGLNNGWHNIVGIYNGTSNLLKIYVDGKTRGNTVVSDIGINCSAYVGFDNISNYFNGTIDEVAVWNRTLSDDEISMMYHGNFGGSVACLTVQNADIGIIPYNNSNIYDCNIVNNTVGVFLNNSLDVKINKCNISGGSYGIQIYNSIPGIYDRIKILDSNIFSCNNGLIVNNSSTISITGSFFNCTSVSMRFNDSNFSSIYILASDSAGNVAPDDPDLSGLSLGDPGVEYTYSSITNDSNLDQILYMFEWGDGNNSGWLNLYDSNILVNSSHTFENHGGYYIKCKAKDVFNNETDWSEFILFKTETLPPLINSVSHTPDVAGFGEDVIISVNATDDQTGNYSGVKSVNVNITYPDTTTGNYTMELSGTAEMGMYTYIVLNPWDVGQYNYTIWVVDNAYNFNSSTGHSFNVSAQATIQVCTVNDSYGSSEWVNLTDPPTTPQIGYELLDDGEVLHMWNLFDSYYFNTSNGLQFSNHFDEYWSTNVLMLGYYNNDNWNLIYRNDELSGFNKNIDSDGETFVNATLWKNLSYGGYDFRLAIRYHLGVDDNELTVIPNIKNIDTKDIPYNLGFAWELKDIQVDNTPDNDYIEIDDSWYYLNISIDETYTNLTHPGFYIRENKSSSAFESLYLRWDGSLNYKLKVKSRTGQYNAPVTLGIKIGNLSIGQEKYTSLFWHDASESVYYFDQYMAMGEEWATLPGNMVDGSTSNYATTTLSSDIELCLNNTCTGNDLGTISKVEIRCYGYYTGINQRDIILRPVFLGGDGNNHVYMTTPSAGWSQWFDITSDNNAPDPWTWLRVRDLDCDVEAASGMGSFTLKCSKVEIRVTYTINYAPGISNPYPSDGSSGISISPVLNITVSDPNGDNMNITWLSNSSGSWQVFGTNNSVSNGTYHQVMSNASVNGQWWYWKVNVSDGNNTNISGVYKFYTGCQSKIVNTGSTNISGYLVMQVHVWNITDEEWVIADDTIHDSSPRTINSGGTLGLDTIFNGNVTTNYLLYYYGNGTYRVYASFCDSDDNVLVCDDDTELVATDEFTVTFD